MEENKFVIKKYAEHTQECGPWFSHVFNPSHTVVAFIGMMPPSGSNIYRFRVYQKKNTAANTSALDTLHNNWEYIGTYDYTAIEAPWDFDAISFDGKNITIKIKSNGQKPALLISFDFNKKYQSFNEQGTARQ